MSKNGKFDKQALIKAMAQRERHELPSGGAIWVRGLTAGEMVDAQGDGNRMNMLSVLRQCLCDEHGQQLFDDEESVRQIPAGLATRLFQDAWRLSGFDPAQLDEMGKGSAPALSGASSTSSPSPSAAQ